MTNILLEIKNVLIIIFFRKHFTWLIFFDTMLLENEESKKKVGPKTGFTCE